MVICSQSPNLEWQILDRSVGRALGMVSRGPGFDARSRSICYHASQQVMIPTLPFVSVGIVLGEMKSLVVGSVG